MARIFVATTDRSRLRWLGPNKWYRNWTMLRRLLQQRFPDGQHADLLTEPVHTDARSVKWFSAKEGRLESIHDLPPERAADVRQMYRKLRSEVEDFADEIEARGDRSNLQRASALRNAMCIPSEESLYVLISKGDGGAQPVLVNWASAEYDQKVEVADSGSYPRFRTNGGYVSPEPSALRPETASLSAEDTTWRSAHWLWGWYLGWLLVAALATATLLLLIPACGLNIGSFFNQCPPSTAVIEQNVAEARTAALASRAAQLRQQIREHSCEPSTSLETQSAIVPGNGAGILGRDWAAANVFFAGVRLDWLWLDGYSEDYLPRRATDSPMNGTINHYVVP